MKEVLHPVQADGKQSAQKWSRGKELGDGLGGRAGDRELWDSVQDSVFIHIYLSFTTLHCFCSSKSKRLLRMKDALYRNQCIYKCLL